MSEIVEIDIMPEMAQKWLARNTDNRRLRIQHVNNLCRMITNGEWKTRSLDIIAIDRNGNLVNGQHRLAAIVQSGQTIRARVEIGVEPEIRRYTDGGITRMLEDRVLLIGDDHSKNRDAVQILNVFLLFSGKKTAKLSPDEAFNLFDQHKESIRWVLYRARTKQKGVVRAVVLAALCEMYERNKDKADLFVESLIRPDGSVRQASFLRDFLLRTNGASGDINRREQYGKAVYCMQAFLDGRSISRVVLGNWK